MFRGNFSYVGRYSDIPKSDRKSFTFETDEKIMHVSLPISSETILMGCDLANNEEQPIIAGTNFSLTVSTNSRDEADRIFNELSVGGKIKMAMNETFWGAYFGALTDKFGISWSINFANP